MSWTRSRQRRWEELPTQEVSVKSSGVLCGILILGVINNGLVLLGVNDNYTNIIKGIIIVGAVALDMKKNTRKA